MTVGVLALKGSFSEHLAAFARLGVEAREVRLPRDLEGLKALVIPGGESTTIGLLAKDFGFLDPLRIFGRDRALWGTCAGAILFCRASESAPDARLGILDVRVRRNAFGRQVQRFRSPLRVPVLDTLTTSPPGMTWGGSAPQAGPAQERETGPPGTAENRVPFPGIFIRAPAFEEIPGSAAEALARLPNGTVVAAWQGRVLATAFHPELTPDDRFHPYFLSLLGPSRGGGPSLHVLHTGRVLSRVRYWMASATCRWESRPSPARSAMVRATFRIR